MSPGCGRADCPLGKVAILDGDPGVGKSLVTVDLCARLSIGQPFPDGSLGPGPSNSIVLDGEDNGDDTIRPRLQALGADLERVFVLDLATLDGHKRNGPGRPGSYLPGLPQIRTCVFLRIRLVRSWVRYDTVHRVNYYRRWKRETLQQPLEGSPGKGWRRSPA